MIREIFDFLDSNSCLDEDEHPWIVSILIALIGCIIIGMCVGYLFLITYIYKNISEIIGVILLLFPALVILVRIKLN